MTDFSKYNPQGLTNEQVENSKAEFGKNKMTKKKINIFFFYFDK